MTRNLPLLAAVVVCGASATAQSFQQLVDSRNSANPYSSVFQIEAGAIGVQAQGRDASNKLRGLEDTISWDGHVYYRDEEFGSRRGTLEAYGGRDGIFASFQDGQLIGDDTVTRFEFRARPWIYYRDGYYQADELRQNGFFDGSDYEGYIGFGREAQDGLYIELGPYYRQHSFARSKLTFGNYTLPEDYAAYGARMYLEQRAVQMDRRRGLPQQGFVLTLVGEREWNDSSRPFGTPGFTQTRLPNSAWRARGRLEWYIPASDSATWEVFVNGGLHDEKDRLQSIQGDRPLGSQWADGQLRLRFHIGQSMTFTPFANVQYSRTQKQDGGGTKDFFLGGGAETYIHFSQSLSLHAWYSFVENENRPSVSIEEDLRGEHMFFVGMVLRLGAARR
tara:strand:+ start:10425 stop:11597 length:1173 start_codon:yes stop_codon:yes gene_type:complete